MRKDLPWRQLLPDETPNDYWDHLVKEKADLPYDLCNLALKRRTQGYSRYMPAHLVVPFIEFPNLVEMAVYIDRSNDPEELARFVWRVRGCDDGQPTRVTNIDWVPDVNEWDLLARFFHRGYTEGIKHEVSEFFKFDGKRIFDPHRRHRGRSLYPRRQDEAPSLRVNLQEAAHP